VTFLAAMPIPAERPEVDDEPIPEVVATLLDLWSIEEIRHLVQEIEAEIIRTTN
jgi:hypothetical protein